MGSPTLTLRTLVVSALLALAAASAPAQVVWIGPEIPVNQFTTGAQFAPSVASGPEGDFVVAWQSADADGSGFAVRARRFLASGGAATGEFALNSTSANDQVTPAVARTADGGFVAVWTSSAQDGSGFGIVARRFNAAGAPLGAEIAVNSTTFGSQIAPRVAADSSGFVVVWTGPGAAPDSNEIFARRFTLEGAPATAEIRLNANVVGHQIAPDVTLLPGGGFVATWASEGQDGSGYAVIARRFDAAGVPLGGEIPVPTVTTFDQASPVVAALSGGGFVVAWQKTRQQTPLPVGPQPVISFRRFTAAGAPLGGEVDVSNDSSMRLEAPAITADSDGGFTLAWKRSHPVSGAKEAGAARFDALGNPLTGEFTLNSTLAGDQIDPAISAGATPGRFNAAWASFGQDGSSYGIVAQRFGEPLAPCVPDGATLCLTGGRFQIRAQYATAAGASGAGHAEALTAESGYFWFFDDANVEIVIKIVDACTLPGFENFWVFATGLTNVDVTLSVLDTATGEPLVYRNLLNQDFQPILDTAHLQVCGAALASAASDPFAAASRTTASRRKPPVVVSPAAVAGAGSCLPGNNVLCLQNGRFEVTIDWQTAQGATGAGRAVPLTADSGYFWFFDEDNVELVIKVVDACAYNDRFWIFAGGLTDVGTHLVVRDTLHPGTTFERSKPIGIPFPPVLSDDAFDTCP